jgi:hypothetical protein
MERLWVEMMRTPETSGSTSMAPGALARRPGPGDRKFCQRRWPTPQTRKPSLGGGRKSRGNLLTPAIANIARCETAYLEIDAMTAALSADQANRDYRMSTYDNALDDQAGSPAVARIARSRSPKHLRFPRPEGQETLDLALQASGLDQVHVVHRPRLLSDNGPSYVQMARRRDFHRQNKNRGVVVFFVRHLSPSQIGSEIVYSKCPPLIPHRI